MKQFMFKLCSLVILWNLIPLRVVWLPRPNPYDNWGGRGGSEITAYLALFIAAIALACYALLHLEGGT